MIRQSTPRPCPRSSILWIVPLVALAISGRAQAPVDTTSWRGLSFTGTRNAPEASARGFLRANAAGLGLTADLSDLELFETRHGLASSHTRFRRTIDGIAVFGAHVTIHQGPDGAVQSVHSSYRPELRRPAPFAPAVSSAAAAANVRARLGIRETYLPDSAERVWFPTPDGGLAAAWKTVTYSSDPLGDWLVITDAASGEMLFKTDIMAKGPAPSGMAYIPNPYQTQGSGAGLTDSNDAASAALNAQRITVPLQGLNLAQNRLIGEYADLATLNSPTLPDVDANEPTHIYNYDRDDPRFEQVVIYHSIDSIQRYFHSLGFDDDVGLPNGIRDYPTLANAHWFTQDQSFYSTGDNAVHFGDGGVDDGEDADIIVHEFGHAVQHDQNGGWFGGQTGAMGEGFSDYLAATFYFDAGNASYQTAHAACVGEWDGTSYSGSNPPCLRRVDGNKMYPDDLIGSVHADGEIWSRALWDIRAALGGVTADRVILEHHFSVPPGATMPVAACELLQADANLNAGVNITTIRQILMNRGILAPGDCNPSAGSVAFDDGSYNAPDTVTVSLNDADLDGNPSHNVTVTSMNGDSETLVLAALGGGAFEATIMTSAGSPAADGMINVTNGDVITLTYIDAMDGYGGMNVAVTDTADIILSCPPYFSDGFEGSPQGWTHAAAPTDVDNWAIRGAADAVSLPNVYSCQPGTAAVNDSWLISPDFNTPGLLAFSHSYNIEATYDGGVIELSENGGPWNDLGASILQGGYTTLVDDGFANPVGGRMAWSGNSGGMVAVKVDLSAAATPFRIRFRLGQDDQVASGFWRIDNVTMSEAYPCGPDPTPTPGPCCPGDANNSGSFVDANDFIAVQANFGADNGSGGPGDANCSGSFVDANDFIAVQANFGADCG